MYLAMADMGEENTNALLSTADENEKWNLIREFASGFGFTGIQISPIYRDKFGLSLGDIPDTIRKAFRVTYHPGGVAEFSSRNDEIALDNLLSESLELGIAINAEDVSIHPPLVAPVERLPISSNEFSSTQCSESRDRFGSILSAWLPRFRAHGISLSLETHFTPLVFIYEGIESFRDFCQGVPGLGVLVDVSHNFYDGYQISEQLAALKPLHITGFHLSDSVMGTSLNEGTHLPIGRGNADFRPLLEFFKDHDSIYGALEVRGPASGILESMAFLRTLGKNSR